MRFPPQEPGALRREGRNDARDSDLRCRRRGCTGGPHVAEPRCASHPSAASQRRTTPSPPARSAHCGPGSWVCSARPQHTGCAHTTRSHETRHGAGRYTPPCATGATHHDTVPNRRRWPSRGASANKNTNEIRQSPGHSASGGGPIIRRSWVQAPHAPPNQQATAPK